MINVSFADQWWHVTAHDQTRGYISRVASTFDAMLFGLYEPAHADPVFRMILRNLKVCIVPLNCVDIKLRVLIFGTQLIVARASRAVEVGSDYEDEDEDDDPACDSEDDDFPVPRPPPPPPVSSPPTVTKVRKMRAAPPVEDSLYMSTWLITNLRRAATRTRLDWSRERKKLRSTSIRSSGFPGWPRGAMPGIKTLYLAMSGLH